MGVLARGLRGRDSYGMNILIEQIRHKPRVRGLLDYLARQREYCLLGDFSAGRYSYLGLNPSEKVVFEAGDDGDPFDILDGMCKKYRLVHDGDLPVPFVGGWVGYLSYDLGRYIEKLPDGVVHDIGLPLLRFCFYDSLLAWDNAGGVGYLLALEYPGQKTSPGERLRQMRKVYEMCLEESSANPSANEKPDALEKLIEGMSGNISHDDYLGKVGRAIEYIKAGDIFEVNLSQRFSCDFKGSGCRLYQYLAEHNPAGYAALLSGEGDSIVSASPELFLSKRGDRIVTRPIKGTAARDGNEQQDKLNRQKLLDSQKEIAELNMIIDLERNDLGRLCQYGSVKVQEERVIETHPTVYHAVATIVGQLRDDVSIADILRASFPGGSVTGAPKIRAMEIIDELEPTARSVYTGSIGWLGVNGDMDLNIAIRTIILVDGKVYVQVGGAVVADSRPGDEYQETLTKAAALVRAIKATS